MRYWLVGMLFLLGLSVHAQDTFSIVAVDPETGEVGAAGASCVDLSSSPLAPDFISELLPGKGAINCQSFFFLLNQQNAYEMLEKGLSSDEIIAWLPENDAEGKPEIRQYGIAVLKDGKAEAAAYTGGKCFKWAGQIVGENYTIQGNMLAGEDVLKQMEKNFLETKGTLADKLMAAMQGANMKGADKRCAQFGTSSLFAFVKVAYADDNLSNLHLNIQVKTKPGSGDEPIDGLQDLYSSWKEEQE